MFTNFISFPYRVEHGSFTHQEATAFNQLVRVLVRDFLPFIKRVFTGLFSATAVEQLALSTPYALRHGKKAPPTSSTGSDSGSSGSVNFVTIRSGRPGVELGMELNMDSIAEPLRKIASDVFEEMDNLKQQQFTAAVAGMADLELHKEGKTPTNGVLEASNATQEQKQTKETDLQERERASKDDGVIEQSRSQPLQDQIETETERSQQQAKFNIRQPSDIGAHRLTQSQESLDHTVTINSTGIGINSGGSQLLAGASPSLVGQLPASLVLGQSTAAAPARTNVYHHHTSTAPLAKDKAA